MQEVFAALGIGHLRVGVHQLSHCSSVIGMTAQRHRLPSSAHQPAALQRAVDEMGRHSAGMRECAVSMLGGLRDHDVRSSLDAQKVLGILGQLIFQVMATAACDQHAASGCSICSALFQSSTGGEQTK